LEFDNAVAVARNFADVNGDTLVLADHECAGFSILGALSGKIDALKAMSSDAAKLDPTTQPERQKAIGICESAIRKTMKPESATASTAKRIQELALRQIDLALEYATTPIANYDEAIHQTRRRLKRVRAALRLIRAGLGATSYDRDNIFFRNIGRQLASFRDAAAMQDTLAKLQEQFSVQLPRRTWQTIKKELTAAHDQPGGSKKKAVAAAATKLQTARRRVEKWPVDFEAEAVVRKGLRKVYKRGRRALAQAKKKPTVENFHEWRKQINHLRHQLQLLTKIKMGEGKSALQSFKKLAKSLGLSHDLAVLSEHLPAAAKEQLAELIRVQRVALEAEALEQGKQLYEEKPKAFIRQVWPKN
jgi:CHAD domain-containing protein